MYIYKLYFDAPMCNRNHTTNICTGGDRVYQQIVTNDSSAYMDKKNYFVYFRLKDKF